MVRGRYNLAVTFQHLIGVIEHSYIDDLLYRQSLPASNTWNSGRNQTGTRDANSDAPQCTNNPLMHDHHQALAPAQDIQETVIDVGAKVVKTEEKDEGAGEYNGHDGGHMDTCPSLSGSLSSNSPCFSDSDFILDPSV